MTISDLKNEVAGYLNRDVATLTAQAGGVDITLRAINDAKRWAQRTEDFEMARCAADLTVDLLNGAPLSGAVLHGTSTPVSINKIERAFVTASSTYSRPIELISRNQMVKRLGRAWELNVPWSEWTQNGPWSVPCTFPVAVSWGGFLYIWPPGSVAFPQNATTQLVSLDIVQQMPEYVDAGTAVVTQGTGSVDTSGTYTARGTLNGQAFYANSGYTFFIYYDGTNWINSAVFGPALTGNCYFLASGSPMGSYGGHGTYSGVPTIAYGTPAAGGVTTDLFLDTCHDFLLFKAVKALEYFVKDSQRAMITQKMIDDAWLSVTTWNAKIGDANSDEITLD